MTIFAVFFSALNHSAVANFVPLLLSNFRRPAFRCWRQCSYNYKKGYFVSPRQGTTNWCYLGTGASGERCDRTESIRCYDDYSNKRSLSICWDTPAGCRNCMNSSCYQGYQGRHWLSSLAVCQRDPWRTLSQECLFLHGPTKIGLIICGNNGAFFSFFQVTFFLTWEKEE